MQLRVNFVNQIRATNGIAWKLLVAALVDVDGVEDAVDDLMLTPGEAPTPCRGYLPLLLLGRNKY